MKKTARITSFLTALLLLFGLAACGAAGESDTAGYAASLPAGDVQEYEGYAYGEDEAWRYLPIEGEEEYDDADESPFKDVATSPLSTFSSDVDTASYSNMRRFINSGQAPEGVRIEELINYFDYDYERPASGADTPFTVTTEVAPCPWNENHQLAMIGVQGMELANSGDIANNIVFLIDVSGSMEAENKLPLLRESFKLMVENLSENDVVSIVTYAGSEKIVADGVNGRDHRQLSQLLDNLSAGGSTAGASGIEAAYDLAAKHFIEGGNNRILLATDGDFNVGISSTDALKDFISEKRDNGVYISVLGFGMGNLKDNRMEVIADNGNGNYAYIDTLEEARKVLVQEFDSTMFTIANDLKLQVEFNPGVVAQYRLIGYDNRRLENEDFNDDTKDAGDIGSGHSVTAFYELVLVGEEGPADVDGLRYQQSEVLDSDEYMNVKVRYKLPGEDESILVEHAVPLSRYSEEMSENFGFASAVAEFGLILTDSQYRGTASCLAVLKRAQACRGADVFGLRQEFATLVETYRQMMD